MNPSRPQNTRGLRAFTMTELMASLAIIGLTMASVVVFMTQALNIYYYDTGRLLVNGDIRTFTDEMTTNAVYSNYFIIYQDFQERGIVASDGQTGDFLLLVFTDTDASSSTAPTKVNRLVGYYRAPKPLTGIGPVRRFDVTISPAVVIGATTNTSATPAIYTMVDLLSAYVPTTNIDTYPVVIQLAQGTAANGRLFYDFQDRSIIIKGQIREQGNLMRQYAVNTYNFTVSPRG